MISTVAVLMRIASNVFMSFNTLGEIVLKHHSCALIVVYPASWASHCRCCLVLLLLRIINNLLQISIALDICIYLSQTHNCAYQNDY